jgi:cell cycle sensor histidine kinase DivJ
LNGTRTGELLDAVAARCERLVNAAVLDGVERLRQRRLIGLALVAPFLISAMGVILFLPLAGLTATMAAGGIVFALSFLTAILVSATGRAALAGWVMLAAGTIAVSALATAAGGTASPAVLVLGALVFESWWVGRTQKAARAGAGAAIIALPLQALLGAELSLDVAANAAHWLMPIAYLALVVPRAAAWLEEKTEAEAQQSLAEIIEAVVIRIDLSGEVTEASAQAQRVLGLAPELLLSSGVFDRMHVADRVAYLCALADLRQAAGFRRVPVRMRVPGAAGNVARDFRPFVVEMMRGEADVSAITMVLRARDDAEMGREVSEGTTARTHDLAATRTLAAVSHELRTPLNCIIGFSDMLMHEMAGAFANPRQKEYVALVRESGNHLLSVVNSILDVSKLDAGAFTKEPEIFSFGEAVTTCRSMLAQQAAEKRIRLAAEIPADIGQIFADKRAVRQILINLVSNAVKFTPEGGAVTIDAKRIGQRLHFSVSDTGIGIAANDLQAIGEPFRQVRNDYTSRYDGTGLGLSLVKGLVALHDGTMSIESEPGEGTTVRISLPMDQRKVTDSTEIRNPTEVRGIAVNPPREANDGTLRKIA